MPTIICIVTSGMMPFTLVRRRNIAGTATMTNA
jgi:hypothetical protein